LKTPFSAIPRFATVVLTLALMSSPGFSQVLARSQGTSRIVQPVDDAQRTVIAGSTHRDVKRAQDLGAVDNSQPMQRMLLLLKPSQQQTAALQDLLESQQEKDSPGYHKWVRPEQFATKFGPSSDDLGRVTQWLASEGFTDIKVSRGGQWIEFSGVAGQLNQAFQTSMHSYELNGERHVANSKDISLPTALTPVVSGVISLHNFLKHPMHTTPYTATRNSQGKMMPSGGNWTATDGNGDYWFYVAPADFQKVYDSASLIANGNDGTGVSIAIAGRTDIFLTDIQAFRQIFGLPQNDPNIIVNGADPGISFNDLGESSLDVEWAGASAPMATINLVESGSTDTTDGIDLSSTYIVDNAVAPIMSVSYGSCEALMGPTENQFYNALWAQAAAEGITVFVSSGDSGAAACDGELQESGQEPQGPALNGPSISGLASTPYNVSVGGTQFNENGEYPAYWNFNNDSQFSSVLGYIPEQAWDESCDPTLPSVGTNCVYGQSNYNLEGGGGGPSNCSSSTVSVSGTTETVTCTGGYAKPSWQSGTGVPSDGLRDTPDLALNASPDDDGYAFCVLGGCQTSTLNGQTVITQASVVGGTSVSAPAMAGIMALVEQKNGQYQGQANYVFYQLAAKDTLSGCNSSSRTTPTQTTTCNFNDITAGSNSVPGLPGYGTSTADWSAGTGYDMATGLGTVNAANLVANWNTVSFASSSTALSSTSTTATHGQPFPIVVKVSGSGGKTPTGNITLQTDKYGAVAGVFSLTNGQFSGSVSDLPGGSYNLTARYSGDGSFGSSTSTPIAVTIGSEGSKSQFSLETVDFSGNLSPLSGSPTYGQQVYFKISVAPSSGLGVPTGSVNILDGTTVLTTVPLNNQGTAFVLSGVAGNFSIPAGSNSLSVSYSGDNSFAASKSAVSNLTVTKGLAAIYISESNGTIPIGQPVFFNATISPDGLANATGTLEFYDNGSPLSGQLPIVTTGPIGAGYTQAGYSSSSLAVGTHTISASYSGDSNYLSMDPTSQYITTRSVTITANPGAATNVTISQTPATITLGQTVTYTVHVTPKTAGGAVPTGQVEIMSSGNIFQIGSLQNGVGYLVVPGVGVGMNQVVAMYEGDSTYASASSPAISTNIARVATQASLTTTSAYVLTGSQTSLSFVAQGFAYSANASVSPSGYVQFMDSVNGAAAQQVGMQQTLLLGNPATTAITAMRASLPAGTNVVTANYLGDTYFAPTTTAPVTITVSQPDFAVTASTPNLTVSAGSTGTDVLTLQPILGLTGSVTLACGSGVPAGTTCTISPSSLTLGSATTATVSLATLAPSPTSTSADVQGAGRLWMVGTGTGLVAFAALLFLPQRRRRSPFLLCLLALGITAAIMGCGGGSSPQASLLSLSSANTKVASGGSVVLTASLQGLSNSATGTVTFYDGSTAIGSAVNLSNDQAQLQSTTLSIGGHVITASYSGDNNNVASKSSAITQVITGTTTLAVTATSGSISHTTNLQVILQ